MIMSSRYRLSVTVFRDKDIKATDKHKHTLTVTTYQDKVIKVTDGYTAGRQFLSRKFLYTLTAFVPRGDWSCMLATVV